MSKNIAEIPVTEIIERVKLLARSGRNTDSKIRGIVKDVATREIPSKFDWNFMIASSGLTTIAPYDTGTASVNTGDTAVTFSSTVAITAAMVGRKFNITGDGGVYQITSMSSTTSCTITPPYQATQNASNQSYSIFQPTYALARDFDRFPKPGGIYRQVGQEKKILEELQYRPYLDTYSTTAGDPDKCRLVGCDTAGNHLVELVPAPSSNENLPYDYFRQLRPLIETTAGGLLSIAAQGTVVTGNTSCAFMEATTGDWFRVDALGTGDDSLWYRIIAITHNSSLTLATQFANTAITVANYTIARAPEMPVRLHMGVIYGALRSLELDQTDENYLFYHTQYAQVMSDAKRIYLSRPYNQEVTGVHEDYLYRR